MACPRTLLCLLTAVTSASGLMDRLGDTKREYTMSPSPRLHVLKRWRREVALMDHNAHRRPCAELAAPWRESSARPPAEGATVLRLRVRSFAQGGPRSAVFPGKSLFNFVRRAYRCCQEGFLCRNVKGIQGHLREGAHAEFLLTPDVLSKPIVRAELHLQVFNPQHLSVHPALLFLAKRNLPTRYEVWPRGDTVELKVDLMPLFQGLADTAAGEGGGGGGGGAPSLMNMLRWGVRSRGGPPPQAPGQQSRQDTDEDDVWGGGLSRRPPQPPPPLELGLALSCSHEGQGLACERAGLRLSHMPFIAVSY